MKKDSMAMQYWKFISPLIPVNKGDQFSMDAYVSAFKAFKLLEEYQSKEAKKNEKKR